ncbi:Leucine-rich repeat domain, L domain-like [Phytophthora cactorum]|nr:Leucine-rich repeat domain, L domain-like [Phytophthora cactorum]
MVANWSTFEKPRVVDEKKRVRVTRDDTKALDMWLKLRCQNGRWATTTKAFKEFDAALSVQELDLSCNALRSLLGNFCNLERYSIFGYDNALKKYQGSCALEFVTSTNMLRELPEFFGMLGALEVLSLSNNALYKLPASFAELTSLTNLSLTGNRIECFPAR